MRFAIVASHGAGLASDIETIGGLPRANEGLLRRIFGEVLLTEDTTR